MPRKRKSDLSRISSRARAAKVARIRKFMEQTRIRKILDAERHPPQRAAKALGKTRVRQVLGAKRNPCVKGAEIFEQTQPRQALDAERHASAEKTPEKSQS